MHVLNKHCFALFRKSRLCFLWDPLLTMSEFRTNFSILLERPGLIIIGGGLWHLATKMNHVDVENRFRNVIKTFENFTEQEEVLFQLQTKSLNYDHGLYDGDDILNLNFLARKVFQNSKVQIFDSHLKLYDIYSDFCGRLQARFKNVDLPQRRNNVLMTQERRLEVSKTAMFWRCTDPNHSPFMMTKHFAQLILNHFLCSKNLKADHSSVRWLIQSFCRLYNWQEIRTLCWPPV